MAYAENDAILASAIAASLGSAVIAAVVVWAVRVRLKTGQGNRVI
jgi:hypothetical protein